MNNVESIACPCRTRPTQAPVTMEWAQINDHEVVVVTEDAMWLRELDATNGPDPFAEIMTGPGSRPTTRQLLDAAWYAGLAAAKPHDAIPRRSLARYVREVIGMYSLTSATPPLLREMATRFRAAGRSDLETFATRFARLEDGDQQMAANDLLALGYRPDDLVAHCAPPASSTVLRGYFADLVRRPEPLAAFGYIYAVERSSLSITEEDLREMSAVLPSGVDALECRRHHSGVGGDVAHVKYFIHACSRLPGPDRARIARATYDAAIFISSIPTNDDADDVALEREYSRFRIRQAASASSGFVHVDFTSARRPKRFAVT